MNFEMKGPDGIRARMQEIQSKIDSVFPNRTAKPIGDVAGLYGSIATGGGFQPFDPLQPGAQLKPMQAPGNLQAAIRSAAERHGLDPVLFDALVANESAYDSNARSYAGAMGLTQLMPATAKSLGVSNPFDATENLEGGARYLSQMLQRFGGDVRLALAAYNAGPGAVERYNGIPPYSQTQTYVRKIMERIERSKTP